MMRRSVLIAQSILALLAFGLAIACSEQSNLFRSLGDDSSEEALVERAEEAMDDEDFEEALEIYEALYNKDPGSTVFATGVAAALMGLAGVDTLEIIRSSEEEGEGGREVFEIIAESLPRVDRERIDYIIMAIDILHKAGSLSCSQDLLLALAESVLLIMAVIHQTDSNGDNIIDDVRPDELIIMSLQIWSGCQYGEYRLDDVIKDIERFVQRDCIGEESTISNKFSELVFSLDSGECASRQEMVDPGYDNDDLCGNDSISWLNTMNYMMYLRDKIYRPSEKKSCSRKDAIDWAESIGCTILD